MVSHGSLVGGTLTQKSPREVGEADSTGGEGARVGGSSAGSIVAS